jgi:hypothetical protein
MNCGICSESPQWKVDWGCESPVETPVWVDEETGDEYHMCPIRYVSQTILDWYEEYAYCTKFHLAEKFNDQCSAWIDAATLYESELSTYRAKTEEERRARDRSNIGDGNGT